MSSEIEELKRRIWTLERRLRQIESEREQEIMMRANRTDFTGGTCTHCGSWGSIDNPPQCMKPTECPHGFGDPNANHG